MTPVYSDFDELYGNGFRGIVCADTDPENAGDEIYITAEEGLILMYNGSWNVLNDTDAEDGSIILFDPLYGFEAFSDY